jgi:hypothetical protein
MKYPEKALKDPHLNWNAWIWDKTSEQHLILMGWLVWDLRW